jgi:hypothetical protein
MAAIALAATMDALAAKLVAGPVAGGRVFAWPEEGVVPPCIVIGYPESIDFDMTFGRGSDKATFPVYFLVGKVTGKASRDKLSAVVTGATAVKNVLDGPLTVGANVASVRVVDCRPDTLIVGATEYLAGRFDTEVIT